MGRPAARQALSDRCLRLARRRHGSLARRRRGAGGFELGGVAERLADPPGRVGDSLSQVGDVVAEPPGLIRRVIDGCLDLLFDAPVLVFGVQAGFSSTSMLAVPAVMVAMTVICRQARSARKVMRRPRQFTTGLVMLGGHWLRRRIARVWVTVSWRSLMTWALTPASSSSSG